MQYIKFSDIVEENGKTIRENNMEIQHNLKIGDLVEFEHEEWFGEGACRISKCRMFIVNCGRDCDGTPLYTLSPTPRDKWDTIIIEVRSKDNYEEGWRTRVDISQNIFYKCISGMPEESLTKVEVTEDLKKGHGALSWENFQTGLDKNK